MQLKIFTEKKRVPLIIFFTLLALYILFGYGVTISNDSVTNIDQITAFDLWSRSSHFSFHLFGIIFYLFFSKLLGLSAVVSIEIMLAVFSAAGAVALHQIVLKKFNNAAQALITVIIYSLASGVFRLSCQVEYVILVPSFGIISLYFYSKGQSLIAGIIFGLGLLTSVLLVLFAPMFLLFTSFKELFKKQNSVFAISSIAVFLAINVFTYQETVSGHWSYGSQVKLYQDTLGEINFLRIAAIYIYGYLRSFNVIIAVLPFILYYLFRFNKQLYYILITIIIIHLPVAIPEARYGGYQMTAYPIIAIAAGYFFTTLLTKRKYLVFLLVSVYLSTNIFIVFSERSFFIDLKNTYVQLKDNLDSNSLLLVYQATKPIQNIYAPDLQVYNIKSVYQDKFTKYYAGANPTNLSEILTNNDTVYLLESGQSMPDDHLKLFFGKFTKDQGAKVKGFALERVLEISPSIQAEKLTGYPLDVYRVTKRE